MLILDASALLGIIVDVSRPDLIRMLARISRIVVVTSHVDAEIIDRRSREALDTLVETGKIAALRINTSVEISKSRTVHEGTGRGEADVILACKKIAADGCSARGVLDERRGRAIAKELGIEFTGLLGLLAALKGGGMLGESDYNGIVKDLRSSKFRLPRHF